MVTAQSMHYYSVSALYGIHNPIPQPPYFNRQRLYAKSVAKLQQKNETTKSPMPFAQKNPKVRVKCVVKCV